MERRGFFATLIASIFGTAAVKTVRYEPITSVHGYEILSVFTDKKYESGDVIELTDGRIGFVIGYNYHYANLYEVKVPAFNPAAKPHSSLHPNIIE